MTEANATYAKAKLLTTLLASAVVEAVEEAGEQGIPAGHVYAAFMHHNISLETFERITDALVEEGMISRRGDLFCPAKKTKT